MPFYSLDSGHASCQDAEDHPADSHLPSKPGDYSFPLSIVCTDGSIHGDFTILVHYSEQVEELVRPLYRDCSSCHRSICLPDFTIMTAARMMQLLSTGETSLCKEEDRQEILQLLFMLGCFVITDLERIQNLGMCATVLLLLLITPVHELYTE